MHICMPRKPQILQHLNPKSGRASPEDVLILPHPRAPVRPQLHLVFVGCGLGLGSWGLWIWVPGLGSGVGVPGSGFRVLDLGVRVSGSGFQISGLGFEEYQRAARGAPERVSDEVHGVCRVPFWVQPRSVASRLASELHSQRRGDQMHTLRL